MITIDASVLAKAMRHAAAVTETRNTIPILSNVMLRARCEEMEIATSDLDIEFRQVLPLRGAGELETTVDARRLAALASAVEGGAQIALEPDAGTGRLIVKSGRSRWVLPTIPVKDFPRMPEQERCEPLTIAGGMLAAALGRVAWCHSTEVAKSYLGGTFLDQEGGKLRLAGAEGNVILAVDLDIAWPRDAVPVIVPIKAVRIFEKIAEEHGASLEIAWSEKSLRFTAGTVELISKTIDGTFPNYRRIIPGESTRFVADPASLRAAVKRIRLIESGKSSAIKFERGADKLTLSTREADVGTASEECPAECEDGFASGFNARFLEDMLDAIGGDSIEVHQADATSPALFRRVVADGAVGVIAPMFV